jgi:hypothetical protein
LRTGFAPALLRDGPGFAPVTYRAGGAVGRMFCRDSMVYMQ